ncbi:MAG: hypothetical protein QNJ20_20145, partial [Paracoccaceae bacterium]|nr:hypothetical protein [Paracoccaceae bacterium]
IPDQINTASFPANLLLSRSVRFGLVADVCQNEQNDCFSGGANAGSVVQPHRQNPTKTGNEKKNHGQKKDAGAWWCGKSRCQAFRRQTLSGRIAREHGDGLTATRSFAVRPRQGRRFVLS